MLRLVTCSGHLPRLLEKPYGIGERKLRLLACAYCRQVWGSLADDRCKKAVETAEVDADYPALNADLHCMTRREAERAFTRGGPMRGSFEAELALLTTDTPGHIANDLPQWFSVSTKLVAAQAALIREIVGNPFRQTLIRHQGRLAILVKSRQVKPGEKDSKGRSSKASVIEDR